MTKLPLPWQHKIKTLSTPSCLLNAFVSLWKRRGERFSRMLYPRFAENTISKERYNKLSSAQRRGAKIFWLKLSNKLSIRNVKGDDREHIKERSGFRGYYARGVLSIIVFGIAPFSFIFGVLLRGCVALYWACYLILSHIFVHTCAQKFNVVHWSSCQIEMVKTRLKVCLSWSWELFMTDHRSRYG